MRPIQWHLKNNWRVPESLEKVMPIPRSLNLHLRCWLEESNVLLGQPLHPLKHALQIFTGASKEGRGAHLNECTQAWVVDALSLSWEHLDPYAFPPAAILGKVVEKLQDYPHNRIILIAQRWPNMPCFWDLVAMSSHIPLCLPNLPNLVSQPFNQTLHSNLSNLNVHAWLVEPQ